MSNDPDSPTPLPQPPPPEQPVDSKITFLSTSDSMTFMVPRTGVRGPALFFLIFALIWNGVSWTVWLVFLLDFLHGPSLDNILPLLFLLLFIAAGVFVFLAFLQTAFRRAVIVATSAALVVEQKAPIKNREFQWKPEELKQIKSDFSGTTINNRRLRELRIYPTDGDHQGFFDGRDEAELEWLAATLRDFYALQPAPSED